MRPQTPVPLVVLLHGLGATGAVWEPVVRELRAEGLTEVLMPDLAGHGEARALGDYTVAGLTAEIAERLPPDRPWVAAGHSLGGYVALALAGGAFSPPPLAAFSLGAKLTFTAEDRQRAREAADRPRRVFATYPEALDRYRKVSGLSTDVAPDERLLARGIRRVPQGYALAQHPATFAVDVPAFTSLLQSARCPVEIVRGQHDRLVSDAECAALGVPFCVLPGVGHNAHAEAPAGVARLIARLVGRGSTASEHAS